MQKDATRTVSTEIVGLLARRCKEEVARRCNPHCKHSGTQASSLHGSAKELNRNVISYLHHSKKMLLRPIVIGIHSLQKDASVEGHTGTQAVLMLSGKKMPKAATRLAPRPRSCTSAAQLPGLRHASVHPWLHSRERRVSISDALAYLSMLVHTFVTTSLRRQA